MLLCVFSFLSAPNVVFAVLRAADVPALAAAPPLFFTPSSAPLAVARPADAPVRVVFAAFTATSLACLLTVLFFIELEFGGILEVFFVELEFGGILLVEGVDGAAADISKVNAEIKNALPTATQSGIWL